MEDSERVRKQKELIEYIGIQSFRVGLMCYHLTGKNDTTLL
jgi:hypothetical protein